VLEHDDRVGVAHGRPEHAAGVLQVAGATTRMRGMCAYQPSRLWGRDRWSVLASTGVLDGLADALVGERR
jgi:hypothetical protein